MDALCIEREQYVDLVFNKLQAGRSLKSGITRVALAGVFAMVLLSWIPSWTRTMIHLRELLVIMNWPTFLCIAAFLTSSCTWSLVILEGTCFAGTRTSSASSCAGKASLLAMGLYLDLYEPQTRLWKNFLTQMILRASCMAS